MNENASRIGFSAGASVENLYLITPQNAENIELDKITRDYVVDMSTDNVYMVDGFSRTEEEPLVYEYNEILRLYNDTLE